jgi:ApbE family protein
MKKFLTLLLALCMGCKTSINYTQKQMYSFDSGFDTVIAYIEWVEDGDTQYRENANKTFEKFSYYNELFDSFHDYENINNIKTINDNAGIKAVSVNQEVIDMLLEAKYFYDISYGKIDVTAGKMISLWHDAREIGMELNTHGEYGEVPNRVELEESIKHKGWDKIIVDDENNTVFITDPYVSLDVGSVAKGYATQRVAEYLVTENVKNAVIDAGGNLKALSGKYNGKDWITGIRNPNNPSLSPDDSLLTIQYSGDKSAVTSGDYERAFIANDGKSYSHIIDPDTTYPADKYRSVTIITTDAGVADCLSTALFCLDYEDGLKVIEQYKKDHDNAFLEVIWVANKDMNFETDNVYHTKSFNIAYTEGLKGKINIVNDK